MGIERKIKVILIARPVDTYDGAVELNAAYSSSAAPLCTLANSRFTRLNIYRSLIDFQKPCVTRRSSVCHSVHRADIDRFRTDWYLSIDVVDDKPIVVRNKTVLFSREDAVELRQGSQSFRDGNECASYAMPRRRPFVIDVIFSLKSFSAGSKKKKQYTCTVDVCCDFKCHRHLNVTNSCGARTCYYFLPPPPPRHHWVTYADPCTANEIYNITIDSKNIKIKGEMIIEKT